MTCTITALTQGFAALLATTLLQTPVAASPVSTASEAAFAAESALAPAASNIDAATLATTLLDHLDAGRFAHAEALFSPAMRAAVPAAKLQQVWESLAQSAGPAGRRGAPDMAIRNGMTVVAIPLPYAKAQLVARISVDDKGQIAGFLVQPATPPSTPTATDAVYLERDAAVGEGALALPGTLTLPKAASARAPVPAVVLVHGSGPHDRDETIGPNRPFLDIARGLAAEGIAVLRYDKRTRVRPQDFADRDFDIDDEVTDDAVAAIASLRATDGIDPQRVYVLGHSLGGMLAPRIARASGHVAGMVLMAAPARPVLDLMLEQGERQAVRDGSISPDERAQLDDLQARIKRIRTPGDVAANEAPMGLSAAYWRSLEQVDAAADVRALTLPTLVIHGGRDIQVVEADWQRWQGQLAGQRNATLKRYPALNHLGIAGTGPGTVEEYFVAGHVDAGMLGDIARWIHGH